MATSSGIKLYMKRFGVATIAAWTFVIVLLAAINLADRHSDNISGAANEARNYYRLNLFYRAWASKMGGVYASVDNVAPNPYLKVPDRDVTTSDNRRLTLVNPAYMTRMVFESMLESASDPIISKIVSLKPLNPVNAPDEWERQGLAAFERKEYKERSEVTNISGKPYLRLISMFVTEESCLKCHAHQGYKKGDVRGAIVISVPLTERLELQSATDRKIMGGYFLLWLIGSVGIGISSRRRSLDVENIRRLSDIVEYSDDAIISKTLDGVVTSWNRGAEKLFGYSGEEMLGKTALVLFPDDLRNEEQEILAVIARGGSLEHFETERVRKDGRLVDISATISPVRNTAGVIIGVSKIARDITERKQREVEMKNLSQRLQLATSSAHLGIWDWNVRENTMVWDERMFELYGITWKSFPSTIDAWMSGLHPEDKETAIAECQAALEGEKEFNTVFRVLHPDGAVKHLRGKGLVLFGADGVAERMIGINYDITGTKKAEEDKARLESQLQQAQKMESVGRLAGGVAHDFNNMLTVILGHAELGMMKLDPSHPVIADLKEISKTSERSADLARQLLAFARKQAIAPKLLDLNETVTSMLKMLQRLIGEDINLSWQPAPILWQVKVDPSQIDQILANLCVNARDAIRDTGRITIETENCSIDAEYCTANPEATPGDYVRLSVSDDGGGMDKETLLHAFEPFFTTKELGKGTGLGLATVYGSVKQNNGFINVYSEPEQGTTFSVYFPRFEGKTGQIMVEDAPKPLMRGQETILLVEDEPAILKIATMMLQKQGYSVLPASTPGEAIKLASEYVGVIHLLMTDVIMPEMNGRDLAKIMLSTYPGMKSMFMSGYTADVIAQHGVLEEGVHFIQKPFSLPNMAAKVRAVLDN